MIHTNFLEFLAAQFDQNLAFVQFFYQFILTKTKNLYTLYSVLKTQNLHII